MNKNKALILNIPEPCTAAWNDMLPEDSGRFCLSCQKKVIDFSLMSDGELLRTLAKAGDNCCGRLHTSQVERLISPAAQAAKPFLPAALLATLVTVMTPENSKAQKSVAMTELTEAVPLVRGPKVIEGRIVSSATGKGLPGVTVRMQGGVSGAISDSTGYFMLNVPQSGGRKRHVFNLSAIGYETKEIFYDASEVFADTISLTSAINHLREVDVIFHYKYERKDYMMGAITCTYTNHRRLNWWQRVMRVFRKKEGHQE
jgi:hypothetical protein